MKYTTTEKYLTKCPNCGAAIGPSDKFCTYCGTRVVYERSYSQEDSYSMDMNKVDFESKADPSGSGAGGISGIVFMIVWCGITLLMSFEFLAGAGLMAIFPFGMFIIGVTMLIKQIKNKEIHDRVLSSNRRYSAVVLDHCVYTEETGTGENRHTVTLAKVKVLATIDGQQKVILIKVGDPSNAAKYPEGSTISIAGSGEYFIIV